MQNLYVLAEQGRRSAIDNAEGAVLPVIAKTGGAARDLAYQKGYVGHTTVAALAASDKGIDWVDGSNSGRASVLAERNTASICRVGKSGGAIDCSAKISAVSATGLPSCRNRQQLAIPHGGRTATPICAKPRELARIWRARR